MDCQELGFDILPKLAFDTYWERVDPIFQWNQLLLNLVELKSKTKWWI